MPRHAISTRLPTGDSALDFAQLHQLRRQVRFANTGAQNRADMASASGAQTADVQVARQFEALFIAQLLKQARQTSEDSDASLFDSPQTRMVQSLGDAQLAQQLSMPGIGLAEVLLLQMRKAAGNVLGGGAQAAGDVVHTSRLPANEPGTRRYDAESISELIAKLAAAAAGSAATNAASAIATTTTAMATATIAAHAATKAATNANTVISAIREAPQHIHAFVKRLSTAAHAAAQDSGVPAQLILSQAALESAWGRREIRHPDGAPTHNVFGIKATPNWTGKIAHVATTEYQNGALRRVTQAFRAYDSYDAAFADYARLIGGAQRYRAVLQAPTPEDAAHRIQEAGYATDPKYAQKLIGIMGVLHETGAQS